MDSNKVICLVDDEAVFHWIVGEYLRKMGIEQELLSFYNGQEIFEYLSDDNESAPDVLLLDINMPVCNGWKFLEKFEELKDKRKMNIYIVSSSIDPKDMKRAEAFDTVESFISKPITEEVLQDILAKVA